jgi:histidine ammonia-lyase
MTSALKLKRVVGNTRAVLAIEALAAMRALDLLRPLRSSPAIETARDRLREISPEWTQDRPLTPDIRSVDNLIAAGGLRL